MKEAMGDNQAARAFLEPAPEGAVPAPPETEPARLGKRSKTVAMHRVPKRQLQLWQESNHADDTLLADRPKTRGDCIEGIRPCPYVSCKHHLYLDVTDAGSITLNFPSKEVDELEESCALDVAAKGGITLEEVGAFFQVTRERIRQIEGKALLVLKKKKLARALFEAGGFVETRPSQMASAQEESESGGGGGTVTEHAPKTPEEEAAEDFTGKVDRIYERTSRERKQGLRPTYEQPPEQPPEETPMEPSSSASFLAPTPEDVPPEEPQEPVRSVKKKDHGESVKKKSVKAPLSESVPTLPVETVDEPPLAVPASDAMRDALLIEKEKLQKKLAAIDVLLSL